MMLGINAKDRSVYVSFVLKSCKKFGDVRGNNVSLHSQKDFKPLKGEDYGTDISNGRFKPASAKHS